MSTAPTLVFIPGSWHNPICYRKVIKPLQDDHNIKCLTVTLPSTLDNPEASFKDDIDSARKVIIQELKQGHDVVVITHSYGGMVGNSAIKGLTRRNRSDIVNIDLHEAARADESEGSARTATRTSTGYVVALVLIASGFTITGLAFMDPFFGIPPPSWRVDKESGYAVLVAGPREFFYHDVPDDETEYWVSQLTTQSLKSLFEGSEYAYAGWQDVPSWYIGTIEDRGLPVVAQRMTVGMARGQGAEVHHTELKSSHSPFLSMPHEVVAVLVDVVKTVSNAHGTQGRDPANHATHRSLYEVTAVKLARPGSWFKFGIPYLIGRTLGWGLVGFMALRRLWRTR